MNRKGHIGTLLMVLGALILVSVALFSFNSFGKVVEQRQFELRGLSLEAKQMERLVNNGVEKIILETINSVKTSQNFETDFKIKLKELAEIERKDIEYLDNNVFAKLVNSEYSLIKEGENYILLLENLFYSAKSPDGLESITRNFSLHVIFTKEKILVVNLWG